MDKIHCKKNANVEGKRFGRLVVLCEQSKEKWKRPNERELVCKCDCGNIVSLNANRVIHGKTKSCGCLWRDSLRKHNVVGKRFGRLVAIKELEPEKNNRRILCKCDCGNEKVVSISYLIYGNTKSCGCMRREILKQTTEKRTEDITGKTFGQLTAIKKVDSYVGKNKMSLTRWLYRCSCGKEVILFKSNVKKGYVVDCGHHGRSIAESNIGRWLDNNNIKFTKEASFDDLRSNTTGHKLYFDFKIYRKNGTFFLVEHQGIQHFRISDGDFGKQQREETDKIKKDYCIEKGITLYETLYNEDYISRLEDIIRKEIEQDGDVYESEVSNG